MEETLGKRIAAHRKRLSLTQDQLAEKLGVTAQAVSKWENDQSCPDIATLPRLAAIFTISTDELLGVEPKQIAPAAPEKEPDSDHTFEIRFDDENKGKNFEFHFDAGRRSGIGIALWIILTAGLLILSETRFVGPGNFWGCLWTSGLLVFGLFGLYPKFSVLRLGCALLGGYELLSWFVPIPVNDGLWLAFFLLLLGLSILIDSLRKKGNGFIAFNKPNMVNKFDVDGETFRCATSFGEDDHRPMLSRLSGGTAEVNFGELTLDLSGCEEIAPHCPMDLKCSFGQLNLLVPRGCKADLTAKKSFASLDIKGSPDPNASTTLHVNCDVSFGQILIRYL